MSKKLESNLLLGICNVMVTLIPIPIISGCFALLSHAFSITGNHSISSNFFLAYRTVQDLYPVLLCVYFSLFLCNKYKISRALLITPSISVMFILSDLLMVDKNQINLMQTFMSSAVFISIVIPIFIAKTLRKINDMDLFFRSNLPLAIEQTMNLVIWTICIITTFVIGFYTVYVLFSAIYDLSSEFFEEQSWEVPEYLRLVTYIMLKNMFWFFGVNGGNFIGTYESYAPDGSVILTSFIDQYSSIGGAGSTLSLVICMILSANERYRTVGAISLVLSIFNINELVIFGVPIMLNPLMMIPFMLAPVVELSLSYYLLEFGVIEPVYESYSWMMPVFYNTYIVNGWASSEMLVQLLNLVIGMLIYYPFFRRISRLTLNASSKVTNDKFFDYEDSRQSVGVSDVVGQINKNISAQRRIEKLQSTGSFELFYQPILDNNSRQVVSAEALIRHKSIEGVITPPTFISDFHLTGMIVDLDLWVINRALSDVNSLQKSSKAEIENISINVSPSTFLSGNFKKEFVDIVNKNNFDYRKITLEITEDVLINNESRTVLQISELRDLGVSIALDDFGSGYSSLGYLSKYKFDKVKIDRILTKNVDSSIGQEIFTLTIHMVKALGAITVVEGVENRSQLNLIKDLGPCLVQGYYLYKPMDLTSFVNIFNLGRKREVYK
ncbi:EAL domain-containing protein [Vibrio sp. Isolate31]|uniref:EAL domain-containing protein n=1 Tax=unclassified Vibrio TaxID=2614977 RepID=UPI001EFEB622|nr:MULTISPECIES: EAL domain-containing protein [unclassified Vibrio]MCG9555554.1 EAL domain-containing protein [Vibrio sp. Isolate32]MCG9603368.1 EAL domain-containing protein [Vibrio sp. Isolate31]